MDEREEDDFSVGGQTKTKFNKTGFTERTVRKHPGDENEMGKTQTNFDPAILEKQAAT